MARAKQTPDEIDQHVSEQLGFLVDACVRYDAAEHVYAKHIAAILRLLLHDTPSSHALLQQAGRLQSTRWLDTAGTISDLNLLPEFNLVGLRMPPPEYFPILDTFRAGVVEVRQTAFGRAVSRAIGSLLPFDEWWNRDVIKDRLKQRFSRRDLVLAVANQDGGSHVDPGVDERYYALSRSNSLGWLVVNEDETTSPMGSPVPSSLRQIAHEVLRSLPRGLHPKKAY